MSSVFKTWAVEPHGLLYSTVLTTYTPGDKIHCVALLPTFSSISRILCHHMFSCEIVSENRDFYCNPTEDCRFKAIEYRRVKLLIV